MKKGSRKFSVFTLLLLFVSFVSAPVGLVMADETGSGKTTADSGKDADKKKGKDGKGKGKDKDEEEPDCE